MKHLRYDIMGASIDAAETRHPQAVVKDLGITYQHATPQSIADQWWFWNCANVPASLPVFLSELTLDPLAQVGNGLSLADAEGIAARAKQP